MKVAEQEKELYEIYHGTKTEDSIGMAKKFYMGTEMFEGIYEEVTDPVSLESYKVLKSIFHCTESIYKCSANIPNAINMTNLTANNSTDRSLLSGRAIYLNAKKVEAAGKKVLAQVMKSTKYKDPNIKVSGEQWEDYLKYCRYMMMKEAEKTINLVDAEEEDAAAANNTTAAAKDTAAATKGEEEKEKEDENKKPAAVLTEDEIQEAVKDWSGYGGTFKGYMAWALWGHIPKPGLEAYKSIKFSTSDSGETSASGRKASRKKKAVEEDKKRSHTAGRGLSAADAITVDDLENRKDTKQVFHFAASTINYNGQLIQLQQELSDCDMEICAWFPSVTANQAEIFGNGGANHQHWYDTFPPYQMWYDARARKKELLAKSRFIAERLQQGQEQGAQEQESKKNTVPVKAREVDGDAEEENTTIPSQIQVSKHSTDDVLPRPSNTSMEEV
jgi:hypothetical protein